MFRCLYYRRRTDRGKMSESAGNRIGRRMCFSIFSRGCNLPNLSTGLQFAVANGTKIRIIADKKFLRFRFRRKKPSALQNRNRSAASDTAPAPVEKTVHFDPPGRKAAIPRSSVLPDCFAPPVRPRSKKPIRPQGADRLLATAPAPISLGRRLRTASEGLLFPFVRSESGFHFGLFFLVVFFGVVFHCVHGLFHLPFKIFFAGAASSRLLFVFHDIEF